jgi:hypothetical protein
MADVNKAEEDWLDELKKGFRRKTNQFAPDRKGALMSKGMSVTIQFDDQPEGGQIPEKPVKKGK